MENRRELIDLVGALEQFTGWVKDVPDHHDRDDALKRIMAGTEALRAQILADDNSEETRNELSTIVVDWRGPMRDLLGRGNSDIESAKTES